jgi:proline iminopeptidase
MSLKSSLDGILARSLPRTDAPGVQVVLVSSDRVVYEGALGLANPVADNGEKVTPSHSANLYSLSKFFTACCVLKLIDNGKLSPTSQVKEFLDDDMHALVNDCTIEQLVAHEAGALNPMPLSWVHSPEETVDEKVELVNILKQHSFKSLLSPAKRNNYFYSNVGYWVLSHAVTNACGVSSSEFSKCCDDLLFSNVKGQCQISDSFPSNKPMAYGHVPRWSILALVARFICPPKIVGPHNASWIRMEPHYLDGVGYGGLIASASSVSNFLIALLKGSILSSESFNKLFTSVNRAMTFGLHIRPHRGLPTYHKEGGGAGCHSSVQIRPQEELAGCVISGDATFDVNKLLNDLLDCVQDYAKQESRIEPQTKFVLAEDGTQLHTKLFTKEINKSDSPPLLKSNTVLLLHGGPGVPDYLQDLAELLIHKNIAASVICFDQRGVGKSSSLSGGRGITMDLLLDDIDAIKKTYDLQKIHLVGHSWGGILAQLYAQKAPESVSSMVLLSPTTVSQASDWQKMELAVMNYNRRKGGLVNFAKLGIWSLLIRMPLISNYVARSLFTMVMKNYYFHPSSAPDPPTSFLDGVSANAMLSSKQAFLEGVTKPISIEWDMFPTLCLFGENDIYGKEMTSSFCSSFKGEIEIIPEGSHLLWVDRPIDSTRILRTFYGKCK